MSDQGQSPLRGRLLWFVALWGVGVTVVGTISFILRAWLLR